MNGFQVIRDHKFRKYYDYDDIQFDMSHKIVTLNDVGGDGLVFYCSITLTSGRLEEKNKDTHVAVTTIKTAIHLYSTSQNNNLISRI